MPAKEEEKPRLSTILPFTPPHYCNSDRIARCCIGRHRYTCQTSPTARWHFRIHPDFSRLRVTQIDFDYRCTTAHQNTNSTLSPLQAKTLFSHFHRGTFALTPMRIRNEEKDRHVSAGRDPGVPTRRIHVDVLDTRVRGTAGLNYCG